MTSKPKSKPPQGSGSHSFPSARKSTCAQESFNAEMQRIRAMSIEDRVQEALGMADHFDGFNTEQDAK